MKKIFFSLLTLFLVLISILSLFIFSSYQKLSFCHPPKDTDSLKRCLSLLDQHQTKVVQLNKLIKNPSLTNVNNLYSQVKAFLPEAPLLLGFERPVSYLILLQNNYEMRANGGFFGSYLVLTLDKGKPNYRFQDIYVPDGQIIGHVDPPKPIQKAFQQGWFRLRDADWDPDFTVAAPTIRWFLKQGKEIDPDFLVTLNLKTIENILAIVGEIKLPDYNMTLNHDNLYSLLQNHTERNFFPGSTQKKDILTATGKVLANRLAHLTPSQYLQIANLLINQLKQQNILIHSQNQKVQELVEAKGWAGKINLNLCTQPNCLNDHYLFIETNLGANKANCCVDRQTIHTIEKTKGQIKHSIEINFTNHSPLENPDPPRFFGGNYISYLRFYLPENAKLEQLTTQPTLPKTLLLYPKPLNTQIDQPDIASRSGLTEIGFFHLTAANTSSTINLIYSLPLNQQTAYQLNLYKQHGMENSPQEINLFSQHQLTDLKENYSINTNID